MDHTMVQGIIPIFSSWAKVLFNYVAFHSFISLFSVSSLKLKLYAN